MSGRGRLVRIHTSSAATTLPRRLVVDVGELIAGGDGLQLAPDGREMRQVPCTAPTNVSAQTWVSADGAVRQRYYNPLADAWHWGDVKQVDEHMCVPVGSVCAGGRTHHVPVVRAIALAWVRLPEHLLRLERLPSHLAAADQNF